jgi:hypothetical protein
MGLSAVSAFVTQNALSDKFPPFANDGSAVSMFRTIMFTNRVTFSGKWISQSSNTRAVRGPGILLAEELEFGLLLATGLPRQDLVPLSVIG